MDYEKLLDLVYRTAVETARRGPGYAQQSVVLGEVARNVPNHREREVQQAILTCWHDLFRMGQLSWGLDIDNPDAPFFHVPTDDPRRSEALKKSILSA